MSFMSLRHLSLDIKHDYQMKEEKRKGVYSTISLSKTMRKMSACHDNHERGMVE